MNLPNKLTLTRILLVPVFMIFVSLTSLSGIADGSFPADVLPDRRHRLCCRQLYRFSGRPSGPQVEHGHRISASLPTRWPTSC